VRGQSSRWVGWDEQPTTSQLSAMLSADRRSVRGMRRCPYAAGSSESASLEMINVSIVTKAHGNLQAIAVVVDAPVQCVTDYLSGFL